MHTDRNAEDHQGVRGYAITECYRLLEVSDGTWRLVGYQDRPLGRAEEVKVSHVEEGEFKATIYSIARYYPAYGPAMNILQGLPMHAVFGPNYVFFDGKRGPAYSERLHLREVRVAQIHRTPKGMNLMEAMLLLRKCA